MIISIIAATITMSIVFSVIVGLAKDEKRFDDNVRNMLLSIMEMSKESEPSKRFSISDYFERREKLHIELMQEREKQEPHIITLWWEYDGLQLNPDGTTEWISRKPVKEEPIKTGTLYNEMNQCCTATELRTAVDMVCGSPIQATALQMQLLREQLAQSQINVAQQIFNQQLINILRIDTNYYPQSYTEYQTRRDMNGNIIRHNF